MELLVSVSFHYQNLAKHNITPEEVLECLADPKSLTFKNPKALRSDNFKTYKTIGKTQDGRYIELVFEKRSHNIFVFHANNASFKDIKLLKRKGKCRCQPLSATL